LNAFVQKAVPDDGGCDMKVLLREPAYHDVQPNGDVPDQRCRRPARRRFEVGRASAWTQSQAA